MIAIIDYGMGNVRSVEQAFAAVGHHAIVTRDPSRIGEASHVVLPGVGAFSDCMAHLAQYGLLDPIRQGVADGKPFLGICLGLQLLFTESEEFGIHKGLDLISGRVRRFPAPPLPGAPSKVPHMGWNSIAKRRESPVLNGIPDGGYLYFVHSYYVDPADPSVVCTMTEYGSPFVSSIWRENVFGCQFHPEKSQSLGLRIIKNFGNWRPWTS